MPDTGHNQVLSTFFIISNRKAKHCGMVECALTIRAQTTGVIKYKYSIGFQFIQLWLNANAHVHCAYSATDIKSYLRVKEDSEVLQLFFVL